MPDFPPPAPAITPADIWTYALRTLTNLPDARAARIDNLDALVSSRLSKSDFDTKLPDARAAKIDKIKATDELASGSKPADGTEQDLVNETFTKPTKVFGWINVSELDVDDVLLVREYVTSQGDEELHATEEYRDAQSTSHCYFQPRVVVGGYRVTIEQTAGVMRTFKYEFFKEAEA